MTNIESELPETFDLGYYRDQYPDVRSLPDDEAKAHYDAYGIAGGRVACAAQLRENFLALLDPGLQTLEIGPLTKPALRGVHTRYFDIADKNGLLDLARQHGFPLDDVPEIDFVSPAGDLSIVTGSFDQVFSSHCIEHQPDLVEHLNQTSRILGDSSTARLFLLIPDKRYCFDHFIPNSTLADVIGAHLDERKVHASSSIVSNVCMTTHNDASLHWAGEHGLPRFKADRNALAEAYDKAARAKGAYCDTHAWQFTPNGFAEIISGLNALGLTDMYAERVYQTPLNRFEFAAVLRRRAS